MFKFNIREISKEDALKMIQKYHYSNTLPKINKYFLGFFLDKGLVGVVTLGWGTRPRHTIQRIFPSLDTKDYLEIGRMCMTEEMSRNSESQMLSQLVKWIHRNIPELKILFTWADGMVGKVGYVYQASRPYNPNIANVFYLAGFIESWGRGIEKICEACKADDLPMPEFTINPGDIMVKFTATEDRVVHGPGKVIDKVGVKVGVEVGEVLSDGEKMVLELLEIDPGMTYVSMAEKLSVSEKTIYKRMKMLRDKGIIVRVGTDKQGYWKINE